jgi:hypothetical protein
MTVTNTTLIELPKPREIISLASSCWLVTMRVKATTMQKSDSRLAAKVASDANATNSKALSTTHHLLADVKEFNDVLKIRQTVDNNMKRFTYPWNGAEKLLPHVELPKFVDLKTEMDALLETRLDALGMVYQQKVSDMAFERGDFFDKSEYPAWADLRKRFSISTTRVGVPTGDYRVAVSLEAAQDVWLETCRHATSMMQAMANKQAEQMVDLFDSLIHGLDETEYTDKNGNRKIRRNKLVETTYDKVFSLCDTIATCNPTNNSALEDAALALRRAMSASDGTPLPLEALKQSDSLRETVQTQVKGIADLFKANPAVPAYDDDDF